MRFQPLHARSCPPAGAIATVLGILVSSGAPVLAQSAEEVVARHLAAIGGKTVVDRVEDKVETWSVALQGLGTAAQGKLTIKCKRPDRLVEEFEMSISGEPVKQIRGFDGKTGWEDNQGIVSPVEGPDLIELRNMALRVNYGELIWAGEAGAKVTLEERKEIDGRQVHVLRLSPEKGNPITYHVDAETYLIRRISGRTVHRGMEADVVARPTSHRVVDGLRVVDEMRLEISIPKIGIEMRYDLELENVVLNEGLEDSEFASPFGSGATSAGPQGKKRGWY